MSTQIFACFVRFSSIESQTFFAQKFDWKLTCLFDRHPGLHFPPLSPSQMATKTFLPSTKGVSNEFYHLVFTSEKLFYSLIFGTPKFLRQQPVLYLHALSNPTQPEIAS